MVTFGSLLSGRTLVMKINIIPVEKKIRILLTYYFHYYKNIYCQSESNRKSNSELRKENSIIRMNCIYLPEKKKIYFQSELLSHMTQILLSLLYKYIIYSYNNERNI